MHHRSLPSLLPLCLLVVCAWPVSAQKLTVISGSRPHADCLVHTGPTTATYAVRLPDYWHDCPWEAIIDGVGVTLPDRSKRAEPDPENPLRSLDAISISFPKDGSNVLISLQVGQQYWPMSLSQSCFDFLLAEGAEKIMAGKVQEVLLQYPELKPFYEAVRARGFNFERRIQEWQRQPRVKRRSIEPVSPNRVEEVSRTTDTLILRTVLLNDTGDEARVAAAANPACPPDLLLRFLFDPARDPVVFRVTARNPSLRADWIDMFMQAWGGYVDQWDDPLVLAVIDHPQFPEEYLHRLIHSAYSRVQIAAKSNINIREARRFLAQYDNDSPIPTLSAP